MYLIPLHEEYSSGNLQSSPTETEALWKIFVAETHFLVGLRYYKFFWPLVGALQILLNRFCHWKVAKQLILSDIL